MSNQYLINLINLSNEGIQAHRHSPSALYSELEDMIKYCKQLKEQL